MRIRLYGVGRLVDRKLVQHDLVGLQDAGGAVGVEEGLHRFAGVSFRDDAKGEIAGRRGDGGVDDALQARPRIVELRDIDCESHPQREDGCGSSEQNREIAFAIPGKAVHPTNDTSEPPHPFRPHCRGTVPLGKGVAGFRPDLAATAQKTLNKQLMYCFYWLSADLWVNEK